MIKRKLFQLKILECALEFWGVKPVTLGVQSPNLFGFVLKP